ncbi:MAG: alpha-amylase family glycosyl hydrolase [Gilvibacter sp.]
MRLLTAVLFCVLCFSCTVGIKKTEIVNEQEVQAAPFDWRAANVYFLLTDRFNNGDTSNDINFDRTNDTAVLRGFKGGDIKGITQKIEEGYFNDLGINAIWMTPLVEQIHDGTDEGTGYTYGFHGYWTKDWTALDPNFGTFQDLKQLVQAAHNNGIRILLDAVINHTGPVTDQDTVWPEEWVRTEPACTYESYESTITCTLVKNLPDIKTESNDAVDLPPQLVEKWKAEGRYEQELEELDAFFEKTGHPRAPRFYIMKWLSDFILDFGIDGFRVDTVRHTEENVWQEFNAICAEAFEDWKNRNQDQVLDESAFYMVGEIYGYSLNDGVNANFGDRKVDYFKDAFNAMINFDLKGRAQNNDYEAVFSTYDSILNTGSLKQYGVLNYLTSHDDGYPFDKERTRTFEAANFLFLTPGASQVYYGDESARDLVIEGTQGDATLRSFMNWNDIESNTDTQKLLTHYQKLGAFKRDHLAVGLGRHKAIDSEDGYIFSRSYSNQITNDKVVVGLGLTVGAKVIPVSDVFADGTALVDAYSGTTSTVQNGTVNINSPDTIVLLAEK